MTTFQQACSDHTSVRRASRIDPTRAEQLWHGVRGQDECLFAGSFPDTVASVMPTQHLMLLRTSAVAAAWAFEGFWTLSGDGEQRTPFQAREAARAAWALFVERAESAEAIAEGFGCDLSAAWEHERNPGRSSVSMDEVIAIAKLAGRMYTALKALKASQVCTAPEEVHSVELGGDIGRLLPSELVHFDEPTEPLLLGRIADKRALQYAMRGQTDASRGPLVIALDESSSMHDEGPDHQRNVWAKASAIALARTALDDGRPVTIVHYSSSCVVTSIRGDQPGKLMAVARHFLGSGTNIPLALHRCAQAVDDMARAGDKGADVVLVSDGEDRKVRKAGGPALDAIETAGARLWTVAIECDVTGILRDRSERYVHIGSAEMSDEGTVGKLAEAVL